MLGQENLKSIVQNIKRFLRTGKIRKSGIKTTLTGGRAFSYEEAQRNWDRAVENSWLNSLKEGCDPHGIGQHEPGAKLDSGKPDASLLGYFGLALLEVAKVGTVGARKYTRGGWKEVPDGYNRYTAAMLRHYLAEDKQERDEGDTEMYHCAQVAWNALARLQFFLERKTNEEDNSCNFIDTVV